MKVHRKDSNQNSIHSSKTCIESPLRFFHTQTHAYSNIFHFIQLSVCDQFIHIYKICRDVFWNSLWHCLKIKNCLKRVNAGKRNVCACKLQGLFVFQNVNMKLSKENWHSPFSSIVICKFHYKTEYCNTKLVYNVVYTAPYSYI